MKSVYDAVVEFEGKWPSEAIEKGYLEEFLNKGNWTVNSMKPDNYICTRDEFEAEANRVYGESSPYLPEINEECEYSLGGEWYYPCTICYRYEDSCGNEHFVIECPHLDNEKQHVSVESVFFRPSRKKAWVEKAKSQGFSMAFSESVYDAMKSGELPVPEVK